MNVFLQRLTLHYRLKHCLYSRLPSCVHIRNYRQFRPFTLRRNGKRDLHIRLDMDLCYSNLYILAHSLSKNEHFPPLLPRKRGFSISKRSQIIGFVNEFDKHGHSHNAKLPRRSILTSVTRPAGSPSTLVRQ